MMNSSLGHISNTLTIEGPDHRKNKSRNILDTGCSSMNLSKIDTMKYEITMLKQPVGLHIAEHVIKKNHINYEFHYPEKANAYIPPKERD